MKAKKNGNYNVIQIDRNYVPAEIERKQVYGITFEQGRNNFEINKELLSKEFFNRLDDFAKKYGYKRHTEVIQLAALSKEEKEILVKYAISNGARKVEPYINALIQNGGYLQILEEAKKKEGTAPQNTINTDLSKVNNLKTACAFIGKYGDFTDSNHPKEVQEVMKQYEIESYTHAVEIQRSM